jgi:hypothetical protein
MRSGSGLSQSRKLRTWTTAPVQSTFEELFYHFASRTILGPLTIVCTPARWRGRVCHRHAITTCLSVKRLARRCIDRSAPCVDPIVMLVLKKANEYRIDPAPPVFRYPQHLGWLITLRRRGATRSLRGNLRRSTNICLGIACTIKGSAGMMSHTSDAATRSM